MTAPSIVREYEPRGAARRLISCRDDEVLVSGPAGTGKSTGGLWKVHMAMQKYPEAKSLLVRKTLVSLSSTTLETWRKQVAVDLIASRGMSYYGGSVEEPAQYRYHRNGARVFLGGLDKPSKIMSGEYDLIFVDEATELFPGDWEALISRLRHGKMPYSQLIGACNPDAEHHWLKQRANDGLVTLFESRHEDNPAYFDRAGNATTSGAAYIRKLDKLTGVRYHRLRKGLWVAAEGVIYEQWNPAVHLVDRLPEGSENWVRWWSIDFGFTNPFVLQCWAEDGDGRLYLYREIYMSGRLVEDHVKKIMAIVTPGGQWREPRPRAVICDHDAEDRATFERHARMSTTAAHKAVKPGLEAVQLRMRVQEDGRPRIFIVRDCRVELDATLKEAGKPTCTAEEITSYVWAKGPDGKPAKEEPEKRDDHGCDTMRYVVSERDLRGRPAFRALRGRR